LLCLGLKKDTLIDKVKKDIQKSGFPLEIEVTSVLKSFGWEVVNQGFYLDELENKPRTIDMLATKFPKTTATKYFTNANVHLIIECKKSEKPWLFYTTVSKSIPKIIEVLRVKGYTVTSELSRKEYKSSKEFFKEIVNLFSKSHYFSQGSNRECVIPYDPFKEGKGQQIVTAINQVIKSAKYQLKLLSEAYSKINLHPLIIIYPLVVFEGTLLECRLEKTDFEIMEAKYVRYVMQEHPISHIVEIISKDFLEDYLRMLDDEIEIIKPHLT